MDDHEITEDELHERLGGPHHDGLSEGDLEHELPIGPADEADEAGATDDG